jgi:mono/diheme cytochrome c family protein
MKFRSFDIAIAAAVFIVTSFFLSAARAAGDAEAGHEIAVEHCARCHVVGDDNPYGGINSTPSFFLLAKRDDYLERFSSFYERRPHPVFVRVPGVPKWTDQPSHIPEFTIQPEQIDDIIAYVETLKPK